MGGIGYPRNRTTHWTGPSVDFCLFLVTYGLLFRSGIVGSTAECGPFPRCAVMDFNKYTKKMVFNTGSEGDHAHLMDHYFARVKAALAQFCVG